MSDDKSEFLGLEKKDKDNHEIFSSSVGDGDVSGVW